VSLATLKPRGCVSLNLLTVITRARLVTLRAPDLNVLLSENRAEMPGLGHFLEDGFKAGERPYH
jgi:hypothetical protein